MNCVVKMSILAEKESNWVLLCYIVTTLILYIKFTFFVVKKHKIKRIIIFYSQRSIFISQITSDLSLTNMPPLDSLVVECWLQVWEVPGSIPSQGPRHTKDVIKMAPVVPLFSTQHGKWKYWLFLKN